MEIRTAGGKILERISRGIGVATNNVAEYTAAIEGLRRAADLGASELLLRSDSRLLIEQLAGRFRVKNPTLQRLNQEARKLAGEFRSFRLEHVPREQNKAADKLANQAVDEWLRTEGAGYEPPKPSPRLFDASGEPET